MKIKYKMPVFLLPLIIIPVITTALIFINQTSADAIRLHEEIMQMNLDTIVAKVTEEHSVLELVGVQESEYYRESAQTRTISYISQIVSVDAFVHIYDFEGNEIYYSSRGPDVNFYSDLESNVIEDGDLEVKKFIRKMADEEYVGYFVDFEPWKWRVVILSEESVMLSAVSNAVEQSVVVLGIVAVVIVGVIFVLSRNIVSPLKTLTDASKLIGIGDFEKKIKINTNDEFQELAMSFNEMTEKLMEYFSKLESVKSELEKQNILLNEEIIEREKTQLELKANEEKFRVIFNNTFHYIFLLDSKGYVLEANDTSIKSTGSDYEEVIGKLFFETRLMGDSTNKRQSMKDAVEKAISGDFVRERTVLEFEDGRMIHLDYTITPLLDDDGNVVMLISEGLDVTELVKKENELIELNKELEQRVNDRTAELTITNQDLVTSLCEIEIARTELVDTKDELEQSLESLHAAQDQLVESRKLASLGSLVIGVSHEINTPVGVCTTSASFLRGLLRELSENIDNNSLTKKLLDDNIKKSLESTKIILDSMTIVTNLVSDFKLVSVNKDNSKIRNFNLCEYLKKVIPICSFNLVDSDCVINLKCENNIEMNSFPDALSQIFSNLIDNSITHGFENKAKGAINIEVFETGENIRLEYKDNGKGMEQEEVDKIFDPFYTTKLGMGRSGLGMNITYNLVTAVLNGTISVKSVLDEGVEITLIIPKNIVNIEKQLEV